MVLRKGQYITTAEHRKHLSKALKKWWSKLEIVDGEVVIVEPGTTEVARAFCDPDEIATGGGLEVSPSNPFDDPNLVNAKYATTGQPGDDPNRWIVSYDNPGPNSVLIQAAVVCAQLADIP